ncbi:hypothetical protein FRIG_15535 [Frigoribacterium faeni]|uniref:hypothetical protein n=1 Tax=Frigoribacterium faeni TaxID=145483 RepID=UPI001FAE5C83|nr:hypothetical protein [Frigoribacterium faeni]MCJ0702526.1 hypothetical protein [Frigoribacterium faeni]
MSIFWRGGGAWGGSTPPTRHAATGFGGGVSNAWRGAGWMRGGAGTTPGCGHDARVKRGVVSILSLIHI